MYIPSIFKLDDEKEKIAFMKKYSFATIITNKNNIPIATQLPFIITKRSEKLILSGHFSAVNEQIKYIENNTSLVIFSEPHAYISPVHYNKKESVPTWDYIAIHAYGNVKILHTEEEKNTAIEEMIHFYEKDYHQQWKAFPETFKRKMLKGIVAFEMEVTELQGQQKLSQNKTKEELDRIVEHLSKSEISVENDLANYIQKVNENK